MPDAKIFAKEAVNNGRQREIDVIKAFSIIMMIITHAIDELYPGYEAHFPSVVIDDYLAQSVGAQGFMICMGIGIVYSRAVSPKTYAKRGAGLLITGQLLNLVRYGLPTILVCLFKGSTAYKAEAFLVFSSDIMQFAGLFFLVMALFARFKLKPLMIFIISIICNILAMLSDGHIATGYYGLDQLLGLFISTETESYFPLMHWMIYPCFGILFGSILKRVKDKTKFYGILILPCAAIFALYYYIGIGYEQPFFTVFNEWETFTDVKLTDALMQLPCQVAMIAAAYFITLKVSDNGMRPVNFISKNINRYYCVHSCMIYFLFYIFEYILSDVEVTAAGCYIMAALIIALTSFIVWLYDGYRQKVPPLAGKKAVYRDIIIIALSVIICIWAASGTAVYPNMYNDYELM